MNPALDAPALRRVGLRHLAVGDAPRGSPLALEWLRVGCGPRYWYGEPDATQIVLETPKWKSTLSIHLTVMFWAEELMRAAQLTSLSSRPTGI